MKKISISGGQGMRKILSINALRGVELARGPGGTSNDSMKQSVVEDNLQSSPSRGPGRQLLSFLRQLYQGTIFLSGSDGSHPQNHLSSTSSEYRMLIQESEREDKL